MKKLFILLLVFIVVNSNAQRYTRQFGVTDIYELNKGQSTSALIIQTDKWITNGIFLQQLEYLC
jgi:hypothetical protein